MKFEDIIKKYGPISSKSIEELRKASKVKRYTKGSEILKTGQYTREELIVVSGICRTHLYSPDGEDITLSFYLESDVIPPYLTRTENELSIINLSASTDVELVEFDYKEFESLMIENIEIRNFGNGVLQKELYVKMRKEIGLATLTAKERLLAFRKQFPNFENLIPHSEIASYLGITNISLSRLRKDLANK